ncbi:MAG: hypothetical protein R2838_15430 [Caldilineaceae bacterium]
MPGLAAQSRGVANILKQYADGLRYLRDHPATLAVASQKAINSLFFSGGFQVIQVIIGERIFVMGEGGGISSGPALCADRHRHGAGPIWMRRFTGDRPQPMRVAIAISYFIAVAGIPP